MIPEVRFSIEKEREVYFRAYYTPLRLDSVSRWAAFHEVGPAPSAPVLRHSSFWAGFTSTISQRSPPRLPIPLAPTPHP